MIFIKDIQCSKIPRLSDEVVESLSCTWFSGAMLLRWNGGARKIFKNEISETVVSDMTGLVTLKSAFMRQVPTKLHEIE